MKDRTEALVQRLLRNPSFQRWAMGDASASDADTDWEAWAAQSADHAQAVREAKRTIESVAWVAPEAPPEDVDAAWERVARAQKAEQAAKDAPPSRSPRRARRPARRRSVRRRTAAWGAAALAALLALGIVLLQYQSPSAAEQVVQTAYGERMHVDVATGIQATLTGNSTLRYAEDAPYRLTLQGEARFDVAPRTDEEQPVEVTTPDGTVRVMGTTFTVSHWRATTDVVLASGVVAVTPASEAAVSTTMAPGDWVTFDNEEGIQQQRTTNPDAYQSWTADTIVFDNTPVSRIAERIEHVYGYNVVIEDASVRTEEVSGAVENELAVLIDGLQQILGRPIERIDQRIIIQ
ncbi:hypothetical protein CRI93_14135 [Longimonas halophila]|uniref:Uncharacterized protein n=1 Tax=Longimonas halophila TaxID=1469170 RepID=A0A2H3NIH5_9BACT|nr:FecR domain-containing protein [Longimonas halophila]PEN04996.1 hypothetical protein CRI93_14135 [Longimonas halophila]